MIEVSVLAAFIGGLLTFFAPCTLPLVPAFLSYLASGNQSNQSVSKFQIASFFSLGFSLIFILLGAGVGIVSEFITVNRDVFLMVGGFILAGVGIVLLFPRLNPTRGASGFSLREYTGNTRLNSLITGAVFGGSFTPCLGPILGGILTLAALSGSSTQAIILLALYAIGLSMPFVLLGIFFDRLAPRLENMPATFLQHLNRLSGILLIVVGILLATGTFATLNSNLFSGYEDWFIDIFGNWL